MSTVIVAGAAGLTGSGSSKRSGWEDFRVTGFDNALRRWFFGGGAPMLDNPHNLIKPA